MFFIVKAVKQVQGLVHLQNNKIFLTKPKSRHKNVDPSVDRPAVSD